MFLTLDKFKRRVEELGERRYFGHQCLAPFTSMEGSLPEDESYHELPEKIEGPDFGINDSFIGRDRYLWLEKTVKLFCMWTVILIRAWTLIIMKLFSVDRREKR